MKAKSVRESVNFERGQEPFDAMDIGRPKFKRIVISQKEYEFNYFQRIENFDILNKIFFKDMDRIKDMDQIMGLTCNNKKLFLETFGKQDFVWVYEYREYAWGFKFPSGRLLVFTGNRGTSYEFEGIPQDRDAIVLKKLFDFIKENQ